MLYTDDVLFGEVWPRPELSQRDRSLITVASLVTVGNTEQLPFHLENAKNNGVRAKQLIAAITHRRVLRRLAEGDLRDERGQEVSAGS